MLHRYRNIQVHRIDLFSDGNYPMGIKITYLPFEGAKSKIVSYMSPQPDFLRAQLSVGKATDFKLLQSKTLDLRNGMCIKRIKGYRRENILLQVTIETCSSKGDKRQISTGTARGGEYFEYEVPDNCVPLVITGCLY
jgi:hypothetical protein